MRTIEIKVREGNAPKVLEQLEKKYYWRFYKDALNKLYLIYTYFDRNGYQYDTPIPIAIKNKNTLKIKICKKDLEQFMRDDYLFNMTVENIKNDITEYINNLRGEKPE